MVILLMISVAAIGLAIIMGLLAPFYSHAFVLNAPVDCTVGTDCFIQNYVDHDTSEGYTDFTCGPLSYDTHKGTDFRLKNLAHMDRGVNVLAVAPGTVRGGRDGMQDAYFTDLEPGAVKDIECGNGVAITHVDGWETQYCHLKQGSITVQVGDKVETGQVLGQIGLSGKTEFPHVHITLRKDGKVIDPYVGRTVDGECGKDGKNLWHPSVREAYAYQPTAMLQSGFVDRAPNMRSARDGDYEDEVISNESPALVYWAETYGIRKGDIMLMTITAPDGDELVRNKEVYDRSKAVIFNFAGKKQPSGGWQKGTYIANYSIERNDAYVVEHEEMLEIK